MKILLINYEYPPIGGGASNATYNIAKSLVKHGHNVAIITASFNRLKGHCYHEGIDVYRIPAIRKYSNQSNLIEKISFVISCFISLPKLINIIKPEKAIIFFSIPCGIVGPFIKKIYKIEYILSLRGGDVPGLEFTIDSIHRCIKPLRQLILRKAKIVVANSRGLAFASEKIDPFHVKVIPNGVDTNFFIPTTGVNGNTFKFLYVGRFQRQKNLFNLLDNIAKLRTNIQKKFYLYLVGDGPLKEELILKSLSLKIDDIVFWHGWKSKEELKKIYSSCNCLIQPSYYEGMPNVVLEAMACGLPIIATNVIGNQDVVMHGKTGFLYDINNYESFQEYSRKILEDTDLCMKFGESGRRWVVSEFTWDKVTEEYIKAICSTC